MSALEMPSPEELATISVARLIETQALAPHFQPIVQLGDGVIRGHEALIRTPPGCRWGTPDTLFAAAREEGLLIELEIECVRLSLRAWGRSGAPGQLFLNLSAAALVTAMAQRDIDSIMALSRSTTVARGGVVVELTEHEHVRDFDALALAVGRLRRHKVAVALDDFGDGRSSLRLWSQLKPEIVKIDKFFSHELSRHAENLQTLRALLQISQTLGSTLVAEGIETPADLHLVRDLGIGLGQGWVLGRPTAAPAREVNAAALEVIRSKDIAVFPERRRSGGQQRASALSLMREVAPVSSLTTNQELFERFAESEKLAAMPIVDDGRPVAIVSRQHFVDRYAKPYFKELYGRKACTMFANMSPRLVDLSADLDELTAVLTSEDQRYLAEGVIITEAGLYRGLGSGEDLVRTVTESRIEAARHANPLTLLPGNIPLTQHIQRLQAAGREYVACYADLNQFKPFNDQYGYWRGDDMIMLAARCIAAHADPRRDFVGHVGGDDFVVLFQSDDWERRSHAIVEAFNLAAVELYDEKARAAGGLMAEDRHGDLRFHPLTTLCIGAVPVGSARRVRRPEDVANAAAIAKRRAKHGGVPVYVLDASDWSDTG
jgi:EAL domain-containing protein (putative c-di-GMP-specific phosphodiesterase class I)/GGDEF domain-containing protein